MPFLTVMSEDLNGGATESSSENQGSMVALIRDDETTLAHQAWHVQGIRSEAHAERNGILPPHESRHLLLQFDVQFQGSSNLQERK